MPSAVAHSRVTVAVVEENGGRTENLLLKGKSPSFHVRGILLHPKIDSFEQKIVQY